VKKRGKDPPGLCQLITREERGEEEMKRRKR